MARCPLVRPNTVRVGLGVNLEELKDNFAKKARKTVDKLTSEDKQVVSVEFYQALLANAASAEDWLELKKELTSGEYRQMFIQQMKETAMGDKPLLDMHAVAVSKILAYVVGWSFVDFNGKPLEISRDTIDKLDQATFREIDNVVDAHHDVSEREIETRKNESAGEMLSAAISPSAA